MYLDRFYAKALLPPSGVVLLLNGVRKCLSPSPNTPHSNKTSAMGHPPSLIKKGTFHALTVTRRLMSAVELVCRYDCASVWKTLCVLSSIPAPVRDAATSQAADSAATGGGATARALPLPQHQAGQRPGLCLSPIGPRLQQVKTWIKVHSCHSPPLISVIFYFGFHRIGRITSTINSYLQDPKLSDRLFFCGYYNPIRFLHLVGTM